MSEVPRLNVPKPEDRRAHVVESAERKQWLTEKLAEIDRNAEAAAAAVKEVRERIALIDREYGETIGALDANNEEDRESITLLEREARESKAILHDLVAKLEGVNVNSAVARARALDLKAKMDERYPEIIVPPSKTVH